VPTLLHGGGGEYTDRDQRTNVEAWHRTGRGADRHAGGA
jgi:hypothetical protein